jgi:hypothetical protein
MSLQGHREFLLHRLLRAALLLTGRVLVLTFKAFFLLVTGCRKLRVDCVVVNNAFLLANGKVMIHWRVKNALWIRVDGKWMGSRGNQVLVLSSDRWRTVTVSIQGFFGRYNKKFEIFPWARLAVAPPCLPDCTFSMVGNRLRPAFSPILRDSIGFSTATFLLVLPPVAFVVPVIPTLQTEIENETRLLRHP